MLFVFKESRNANTAGPDTHTMNSPQMCSAKMLLGTRSMSLESVILQLRHTLESLSLRFAHICNWFVVCLSTLRISACEWVSSPYHELDCEYCRAEQGNYLIDTLHASCQPRSPYPDRWLGPKCPKKDRRAFGTTHWGQLLAYLHQLHIVRLYQQSNQARNGIVGTALYRAVYQTT